MNNNDWKADAVKAVAIAVIAVAVIVSITMAIRWDREEHREKPVTITQEDAKDPGKIEEQLKVTPIESRVITREIQRSSDTPPAVTYYVQAPTVQKAAEDTAKQLKSKDKSLPVKALEKSDRTIVTPDEQLNKVDVYKINLRKAHKVKTGVSYVYDKSYFTAGYQAGRWEGLTYFDWNGKPKGGSVLYTALEW